MLGLDTYTDPAAVQPRLQAALPRLGLGGARVDSLEVMHALRRSPRRDPASEACRIAVCYALQLAAPSARRQIIYGRVYPAAAGERLSREAGGLWNSDLCMALWVYPADPGLPQLAALDHPERVRGHMPRDVSINGRLPAAELVRYRPEERATLRWHLADGQTLYGKTFAGDAGASLHARFQHFANAQTAGGFEVATPLGYDAATRTFWQQGVAAQPLAEVLDADRCDALMASAARALAQLHAADLPAESAHDARALAAACERRAAKIARCMPELAGPAQEVAAIVAQGAPRYAGLRPTLIHGDFHLEQLHLRRGRLVLFDFDEFCLGDPLEDLASFIVKWPLSDTRLAGRACAALAAEYARLRPQACESERLDWHLAVQWLHKASRAYVWQRPGWRTGAARMIAEAQRCAARVARQTEPA
jgi:aminoglycoside phosphotransferase (APT) family kinase protein